MGFRKQELMLVSDHAVNQYMCKISNCSTPTEETKKKVQIAILKLIESGTDVRLTPKEELIKLLNNKYKVAKYIYNSGVLFVVVEDVVVTCYPKKKKQLLFE